MTTYKIRLNTIDKVKRFVDAISTSDDAYELTSGSYAVNAKSILAIFTLDLTRPLELITEGNQIPEAITSFLV